jgi:hypothetical protein
MVLTGIEQNVHADRRRRTPRGARASAEIFCRGHDVLTCYQDFSDLD